MADRTTLLSKSWRCAAVAVVAVVAASCAPTPNPPPAPLISGEPTVGAQLSVTSGAWLFEPQSFAYSWRRCFSAAAVGCTQVGTGSTYVLGAGDLGSWIEVVVSATNVFGSGTTKSGVVGPVVAGTGSTTTTTTTTTSTTTTTTLPGDNDPPVINFFFSASSARSDQPVPATISFAASVTDPDGDALTCDIDADDDGEFETAYPLCGAVYPVSSPFTYRTSGTHTATLRVSDGVAAPVFETVTVEFADAAEPFNITLDFDPDDFTEDQIADLEIAAGRWEQLIQTGIPDTFETFTPAEGYFCDHPLSALVDDVRIKVIVKEIDGPASFFAFGGYCGYRYRGPDPGPPIFGDGLPSYGEIHLDIDDLATVTAGGRFEPLVAHEIGHVLGLGTSFFWNDSITDLVEDDLRLYTPAAVGAWKDIGGDGAGVPVEDSGPVGTIASHWRESVFDNELMTGRLRDATNYPLSSVTAGFMADFGWPVDLMQADSFTLGSPPPPPPPPPGPVSSSRGNGGAVDDRSFGPPRTAGQR